MTISLEKVLRAVSNKVYNMTDLTSAVPGIRLEADATPAKSHQYRDGAITHMFEVDTAKIGIMAAAIKSLHLSLYLTNYEYQEEEDGPMMLRRVVRISLDYQHQGGGSNGFTIGTIWLDEDYNMTGAETAIQRQQDLDAREKEYSF